MPQGITAKEEPLVTTDTAAPAHTATRERLEAAARAVRDAYDTWKTELQRRDQLVADAIDEGMPHRAIAAALGISQPRVGRLLLPRADR